MAQNTRQPRRDINVVKAGQIVAGPVAAVPLASVVVACRNEGSRIWDTLGAVLAQTCSALEVIFVDRGSDRLFASQPPDVCADSRVRVMLRPGATMGAAWNAGIGAARAPYVCCLEEGQKLDPTYLEKCLFVLETSESGLCVSRQRKSVGNASPAYPGPLVVWDLMTPDYFGSAAVFRKELWSRESGYQDDVPPGCEGWDLWIRLAKGGAWAYDIPELPVQGDTASFDGGRTAGLQRMREKHAGLYADPKMVTTVGANGAVFSYAPLVEGAARAKGEPTILLAMPALTMGGAEASMSQACRRLSEAGFRILVVTTLPPMEDRGDTTAWFEERVAGIYHLPNFLEPRRWKGFIFYLLERYSVDILWQVGCSYLYSLMPEIKQYFPDITIVDLLFNPAGHTASYLKYRRLIDHIVTEHEGMRDWLLEHGEIEEHISVIPNRVDVDWFSPGMVNGQDAATAPAGERSFVAGFFGRLSDEKAPDLFIDIAEQLAERRDMSFMLCGTGPLITALQARVQVRDLSSRVRFLGFVETREHLKLCDAVVVCSRLDGRPNIVMEAAAMGIPVVASRLGGIPAMLQDGITGILCEAGDVPGFCAALIELADQPELRAKMGRAARQWAEQHFSHREEQNRYDELFRRLIRIRGAGGQSPPRREAVPLHAIQPEPCLRSRPAVRLTGYARALLIMLSPHHLRSAARNIGLWMAVRRSRDRATLLHSLFDRNYYLTAYPEVADSGIPPLLHYLFYGFRELRNPSRQFDTGRYLRRHPHAAVTGVNPLLHYILREGARRTQKGFHGVE
jgi:glycosyltransferase involved in cell wall biosynthesis